MITVVAAPPFATVQDLGRFGYRDVGVPVSGIADRDSGVALNALLGNEPDAAMIEWAVAGGVLRFDAPALIAIGGADALCQLDSSDLEPWQATRVTAGAELRVERILRGRFLLVAVAGGVDVPRVLGSRSTLTSAAIGGHEGRRLRNGDRLNKGPAIDAPASGLVPSIPKRHALPLSIVRGPQASLFDEETWTTLLGSGFTISISSDRSGYRLDGPAMRHRAEAALPSEPACVGAIQVPDGGTPIVIMHDGPTVGGYPKMAVIRRSSLSRFAQLAPGDPVRFTLDTPD